MIRRRRRMAILAIALACVGVATALTLIALREQVTFFYSPSELATGDVRSGERIRLGGLVVEGSLERQDDGLTVRFALTDGAATSVVVHTGILPDLFREGQGIVATGTLTPDGVLVAEEVLAKHDENYMPPEVAEALMKTGHWRAEP